MSGGKLKTCSAESLGDNAYHQLYHPVVADDCNLLWRQGRHDGQDRPARPVGHHNSDLAVSANLVAAVALAV